MCSSTFFFYAHFFAFGIAPFLSLSWVFSPSLYVCFDPFVCSRFPAGPHCTFSVLDHLHCCFFLSFSGFFFFHVLGARSFSLHYFLRTRSYPSLRFCSSTGVPLLSVVPFFRPLVRQSFFFNNSHPFLSLPLFFLPFNFLSLSFPYVFLFFATSVNWSFFSFIVMPPVAQTSKMRHQPQFVFFFFLFNMENFPPPLAHQKAIGGTISLFCFFFWVTLPFYRSPTLFRVSNTTLFFLITCGLTGSNPGRRCFEIFNLKEISQTNLVPPWR